MKVVGLVSGGKDSCFAMMRCLDHGHQIVALANLLPLDDSIDELDSFMYQTVGHQIVVAYSQCMGLPLFRRRIQGRSRALELRYTLTEGDEVEDLYLLIKEVKNYFPTLGGVSSGAIASDYQRMRVENVCSRLGLVSLAFLWKQEQASLLQQMIASGINAILVKVAAIGLDPQKHLGKDLAVLQPYLACLKDLYGINICGEGGEYETLTLDCPLFKDFIIVLDEFTIELHSPGKIAPVGILHPIRFHLEPKQRISHPNSSLSMPWVQEVEGNAYEESLTQQQQEGIMSPVPSMQHVSLNVIGLDHCITSIKQQHGFFTISFKAEACDKVDGLDSELDLALTLVQAELRKYGLGWEDVLYIHLYLADMGSFTQSNQTYMNHITEKICIRGVPSRSTVELPLIKNNLGKVMLEVIASASKNKKVLHVQSISCWAPSCIGPYSQATLHKDMLYMAGQLGLDPPSMVLVSGGAGPEMEQALRNCEAVALEFSSSITKSAISILIYCSSCAGLLDRQKIERTLYELFSSSGQADVTQALILYVQVPALPKGAFVEVEPLLHIASFDNISNFTSRKMARSEKGLAFSSDDACEWIPSPCESVGIAGKYLKTFLSLCLQNDGQNSVEGKKSVISNSNPTANSPKDVSKGLSMALNWCMQTFSTVLEEALFSWRDVVAFRIFFVAEVVSKHVIVKALNEVLNDSNTSMYSNEQKEKHNRPLLFKFPDPICIPVMGLGRTSNLSDLISIDILALGI